MEEGVKGRFTWCLKSPVPLMSTSPDLEAKSRLLSLKSLLKYGFYAKQAQDLCCELGLAFCPKPHLQDLLPCRHPCHTWVLRLGTPCEVVSPTSMLSMVEIT